MMNSKVQSLTLNNLSRQANTKIPLLTNGTKFKKSLTSTWAPIVLLKQVSKKRKVTFSFFPTILTDRRLFCGLTTLTRVPEPMVSIMEKPIV